MKHPIIYISLLLFTLCFIACDPENVIVTKPVVDSGHSLIMNGTVQK